MAKTQLKIDYVDIDTLKPWDKNPKRHDIEMIKDSMDKFGITQPILVQKKSNRVIAGHGRLQAFRQLGKKNVPVILLDLPDNKAKAYALVDNQATMIQGWDGNLLETIFTEMGEDEVFETIFPYFNIDLEISDFGVNPEDITRGEEHDLGCIERQNENHENNLVEVVCPHCAKPFFVNKDEVRLDIH